MADIVRLTLERMRQALEAGLPPEAASMQAEALIRAEHGGCEVYVAKRSRTPAEQAQQVTMRIASGIRQGRTLREIQSEAGITERTLFRHLARPARR